MSTVLFGTEQRPCAGRDIHITEIYGRRKHCRSSVVRGGKDNSRIIPYKIAHLLRKPAHYSSGLRKLAEQASVEPECSDDVVVPFVGYRINHARGRSVGIFLAHLSREPIIQVIGQHEKVLRFF